MDVTFLLAELTVLGLIFVVLSYKESKAAPLKEMKEFYKAKFYSIILFVIGFVIHTIGDLTPFEMQWETAGHFIIMVGAFIVIKQSRGLSKIAEEYGYA